MVLDTKQINVGSLSLEDPWVPPRSPEKHLTATQKCSSCRLRQMGHGRLGLSFLFLQPHGTKFRRTDILCFLLYRRVGSGGRLGVGWA